MYTKSIETGKYPATVKIARVIALFIKASRINQIFHHDVDEILDLSQSKALNLVMWRVRVMQPMIPSPWRQGRSCPSLMFRKMDNKMSLENILQDKTYKINCKEKWYSVGKMIYLIKLVFYQLHLNLFASRFDIWNLDFIWKVPLLSPIQI